MKYGYWVVTVLAAVCRMCCGWGLM